MNPILMAVAEESVNMLQFPDKDTSFKLSNVVLQLQDCSQSCSSSKEIDRTLLHVMSKSTTCRFVHVICQALIAKKNEKKKYLNMDNLADCN